jgi:hypothetical protein
VSPPEPVQPPIPQPIGPGATSAQPFLDADYPALFVSADEASKRGQERYILLTRLEIVCIICSAALGALISVLTFVGAAVSGTRIVAALSGSLLIAAALVRSVARSTQPTGKWFEGRAIAESTKSLAWLYMMRVEPFDGPARQSDANFSSALRGLIGEQTALPPPIHGDRSVQPHQISGAMRAVRLLPFHQRRSTYVQARLNDQLSWYSSRSVMLRRSNDRAFVAGIVFEVLALGAAMALIAFPTGPNFIGIFAVVTAVATTLSRLRGDTEVADRYALAAQELSMIRDRVEAATEHNFPESIKDAEGAISREHKMWAAKRH